MASLSEFATDLSAERNRKQPKHIGCATNNNNNIYAHKFLYRMHAFTADILNTPSSGQWRLIGSRTAKL